MTDLVQINLSLSALAGMVLALNQGGGSVFLSFGGVLGSGLNYPASGHILTGILKGEYPPHGLSRKCHLTSC